MYEMHDISRARWFDIYRQSNGAIIQPEMSVLA